jgi:hypothetical protein
MFAESDSKASFQEIRFIIIAITKEIRWIREKLKRFLKTGTLAN